MRNRKGYNRVARERLSEQVAEQVQNRILTGELQPGDRLPPEQELCDIFGVSRTAVREATRILDERGLVTIEHGRGTFVSSFDPEATAESISLLLQRGDTSFEQLSEVRYLLETGIVSLAAQRIQPEELARMEDAISQMDQSIDSPDEYISADLVFHQTLAEATRNTIFPVLLNSIADLLRESRRTISKVGGALQRGQEHHREILAAMRAGDPERARQAMTAHMQQVAKDTQAAMELQEGKRPGTAEKAGQ